MQSQLGPKSRIEIPNYPGCWSLFSEGKSLLDNNEKLDEMTDHFR